MTSRRYLVMLGTDVQTKGGIASVIQVYKEFGLFDHWPIRYLPTHCDGALHRKLSIMLVALAKFTALLIARRIAILHVHMASRASFWRKCLFIWPAYWAGVNVIIHLHGGEFRQFYGEECGAWKQRLIRTTFRRVQKVIALSEEWRRWIEKELQVQHVVTIYNPVPMSAALESRSDDGRSVLFLGRLVHRKGVYDLVEAVTALVAEFGQLRVVLGGEGDIEQVQSLVRSRGVEGHFQILGWIDASDKAALWQQTAVFVLPSYNEGLPMSVLEAMAHAVPVVTTPVGGIPEAVQSGVNGILIQPGDSPALAEAIRSLLRDADLRRRMGEAGFGIAKEKFAMETVMPQLEQLYRNLTCPR